MIPKICCGYAVGRLLREVAVLIVRISRCIEGYNSFMRIIVPLTEASYSYAGIGYANPHAVGSDHERPINNDFTAVRQLTEEIQLVGMTEFRFCRAISLSS